MAEFDIAIRGGTIIDGLRSPRFRADIGIKDGRIAVIGRVGAHEADRVLDATGLIVAPGFVDLHTHYDSQVFWDPWCTISGWHGVTSCVIGNCGFGFAPVRPEDQDRAMLSMARNEAVPLKTMRVGMPWDWETYPEFLDSIDRTPKGINLLSYVGLNPLMAYVMGLEAAKSRPANDAERDEMCRLLTEAMEAGGAGFSAQLLGEGSVQRDYDGTPMITDTMAEADLLAFAGVLGKLRYGFTQFMGGTFDLHEKVAEISGRPVVYNLIAVGARDQHGVEQTAHRKIIDWLVDANSRGLRIYAQALVAEVGSEFTLKDWNLYDTSPLWRRATLGTTEDKLASMADPELRTAMRAEYDSGRAPRTAAGEDLGDLIVEGVESEGLKALEGLTVAEIAAQQGKHIIDAMLDLAIADNLDATFVTPPQRTDMVAMKEIATAPHAIPGVSDGGAHTKFLTLGAYPTEFLTKLVRDGGIMDLEEAHWRLSAYPAQAAGFRDRGSLKEGSPADIVVYDYEGLEMLPTEKAFDFPANEWRRVRKAKGYRWTIVNGEITFEDGVCTGKTPGRLLRHGLG